MSFALCKNLNHALNRCLVTSTINSPLDILELMTVSLKKELRSISTEALKNSDLMRWLDCMCSLDFTEYTTTTMKSGALCIRQNTYCFRPIFSEECLLVSTPSEGEFAITALSLDLINRLEEFLLTKRNYKGLAQEAVNMLYSFKPMYNRVLACHEVREYINREKGQDISFTLKRAIDVARVQSDRSF
jgi:hypothetical protein